MWVAAQGVMGGLRRVDRLCRAGGDPRHEEPLASPAGGSPASRVSQLTAGGGAGGCVLSPARQGFVPSFDELFPAVHLTLDRLLRLAMVACAELFSAPGADA